MKNEVNDDVARAHHQHPCYSSHGSRQGVLGERLSDPGTANRPDRVIPIINIISLEAEERSLRWGSLVPDIDAAEYCHHGTAKGPDQTGWALSEFSSVRIFRSDLRLVSMMMMKLGWVRLTMAMT
jgi:hypothetical protein